MWSAIYVYAILDNGSCTAVRSITYFKGLNQQKLKKFKRTIDRC